MEHLHEGYENMVFRIARFVNGVSTVFSNDDTTAESGYAVVKYDLISILLLINLL